MNSVQSLLNISSGSKNRLLTAVFGNFPSRWLGKYSYGIYLLHPFVIGYWADRVLMSPGNRAQRLGSASGSNGGNYSVVTRLCVPVLPSIRESLSSSSTIFLRGSQGRGFGSTFMGRPFWARQNP